MERMSLVVAVLFKATNHVLPALQTAEVGYCKCVGVQTTPQLVGRQDKNGECLLASPIPVRKSFSGEPTLKGERCSSVRSSGQRIFVAPVLSPPSCPTLQGTYKVYTLTEHLGHAKYHRCWLCLGWLKFSRYQPQAGKIASEPSSLNEINCPRKILVISAIAYQLPTGFEVSYRLPLKLYGLGRQGRYPAC